WPLIDGHEIQLPPRQCERQGGKHEHAGQRKRPDHVTQGRRATTHTDRGQPGGSKDQRRLDNGVRGDEPEGSEIRRERVKDPHGYAPVLRAWSISLASLSSSTSESFCDDSSSSAEIACSADPSKNVFNRWCKAERWALSRPTVGKYT